MENELKKLVTIVGPTSSGKTTLAMRLCEQYKTAIVSADSRQVVKGLDIGTGKTPTSYKGIIKKNDQHWLLGEVPIWGYDLYDPAEYFSAYDYSVFARNKLNELWGTKNLLFLVGGTGFYVDTITGRKELATKSPDFALRDKLEKASLDTLVNMYSNYLSNVDTKNKVRVIRAIEKAVGDSIDQKPLPKLKDYKLYMVGLNQDRKELYDRADRWVDEIWKNGLIEETRWLLGEVPPKSHLLQGLIYKSAHRYIKRELPIADAIQECKFNIHAYIRRQLTWFRKDSRITWIDTSNRPLEDLTNGIQNMLKLD